MTLKQSMVDTKNDEKEALERKTTYHHYLDERKKIMKNTRFKVEDIFGYITGKENISEEHILKPNIFLAKIM